MIDLGCGIGTLISVQITCSETRVSSIFSIIDQLLLT